MKKIILSISVIAGIAVLVLAWMIFGSGTDFKEKRRFLYIHTGETDRETVLQTLDDSSLIANVGMFEFVANRMNIWKKLKPGKYEIKKGTSVFRLARILRNNTQAPVNLVINKVRTKEDLAELIGKNFEADAGEVMDFISNGDSLSRLDVTPYTFMTIVIPNTYSFYWSTSPGKIFRKLKSSSETFWSKNDRMEKAKALGFTPEQVYTIASIVEEETNKLDEKGNVASVYINRYRKGMKLGADPTVKFALNDFSLKRIYEKHLQVESPYNTYRVNGLPPGPICTPSSKTIDAVLNSPKTDYMFFVAKSDFSGYHTFTTNYSDHLKMAREYQKALDEMMLRKQNAKDNL